MQHRPREELDKVAGEARHQGVVARTSRRRRRTRTTWPACSSATAADTLVLVLDGVTDPHNLGACLRSAAAAKVTAVIVPKDRAVGLTPVVRRASAGGADRVPLIAVTNLARTLRELKDAGVWITGLAGDTDTTVYGVDFRGPVALVLGSEGEGIRRLTRELCDFVAKIPMPGSHGKPQRFRRHRRGAVRGLASTECKTMNVYWHDWAGLHRRGYWCCWRSCCCRHTSCMATA